MRVAKDGKPFDVDNIDEDLMSDEVELIQFLRPDGKRRRMAATVGEKLAKKASALVLSTEVLPTGEIALYAKRLGASEEKCFLAENGPGKNFPTDVLIKLIKEF